MKSVTLILTLTALTLSGCTTPRQSSATAPNIPLQIEDCDHVVIGSARIEKTARGTELVDTVRRAYVNKPTAGTHIDITIQGPATQPPQVERFSPGEIGYSPQFPRRVARFRILIAPGTEPITSITLRAHDEEDVAPKPAVKPAS
jgi:hypothetical protein